MKYKVEPLYVKPVNALAMSLYLLIFTGMTVGGPPGVLQIFLYLLDSCLIVFTARCFKERTKTRDVAYITFSYCIILFSIMGQMNFLAGAVLGFVV